jgi:RNA polymerase sigma-70 factor (ECF subfamily)
MDIINAKSDNQPAPCLLGMWGAIENTLYHWLYKQSLDSELAFDLLQETFLKALQIDRSFCEISNQRAWLFKVASNLLTDEWRKQKRLEPFNILEHSTLQSDTIVTEPVDSLVQCLPKALACLSNEERRVIEFCDLEGKSQQDFAAHASLSLPAVKSRIQRARRKLRDHLKNNCAIRFDEHNRICCFFPSKESM